MTADPASISVIVPSYGSDPHLMDVLDALHRQSQVPAEIIVAHSGTDDPSAKISARHSKVKVVHSDKRWYPGAARNAGAAIARSPWLAFVDSDVIVSPGWLTGFAQAIGQADGAPAAFCGAIDCAPGADYWAWCSWWIACGAVHSYNAPRAMVTGPGGNMALSADCFKRLGGFREDLFAAEDGDLHARLHRMGGQVLFVPAAQAVHVFQNGTGYLINRLGAMGGHGAKLRRWHQFVPGQAAVRWPVLSLGLWMMRLLQMYLRALRSPGAPVWNLIWHTPGILAGLLAWNCGFTAEAFRGRNPDLPERIKATQG